MTRRRRWFLPAVLGALALIALGASLADAQGDDERRGTDPLSSDEEAQALEAAGVSTGDGEGAAPESDGEADATDDVVVLVERHEDDKADQDSGARRADVYTYSYDDTLTLEVVDLGSGDVDDTQSTQGVQLPLTAAEGDHAVDLALGDTEFMEQLDTEFQTATGRALADPDADLEIEPIVFKADAMPTVAAGPAAACGVHRCAQLMIQTTDHVLINLLPIVDLSDDRLVERNGFFQ